MKTFYIPANQPQPTIYITLLFKDISKLIIGHWIGLRLIKVIKNIKLLTFSFITTTFHYVINKNRYQHNAS